MTRLLAIFPTILMGFTVLLSPIRAEAEHGVFNPQTVTLANGMQVVVVSNHRMPVVTHMLWYKAGSADEPPGKTGVAHLLEHLMFKGTEKFPSGAFSKNVARVGGSENAFTSRDYTGYYQTIARDHLEKMMVMEADRMKNLLFDAKEVDTERLVVLEERRRRTDNDPGSILAEHVNAALYLNYPYRRPIIGWEHEIRDLNVADLRSFYRRWYSPGNAILVVAGDITMAELKPMAQRTYGQIPAASLMLRGRPSEPPQRASRRVTLKDARVRQPSWSRTYLAPSRHTSIAGGPGSKHSYALEVLSGVISGGATSQIYRSLVVEKMLAVSAGAGYGSGSLGPSRFTFYASPAPTVSMETLEQAMEDEVAKLLEKGVRAEDVERVKKSMIAEAIYARDSLSGGARTLGAALASGRTIEDVEQWPHRISDVTLAQVNAAARAVLADRPSVTSVLEGEAGQ
ncbi:MAG: insulinase family protein [Rhodospirillales bacterium]|nr:insulinase family protein [Rhodospirillales bacterium]